MGVNITISGKAGDDAKHHQIKDVRRAIERVLMKNRNRYLKVVEWSEEDDCFVGRVPGLALGGVHGKNEKAVYEKPL